ncbi:MAG: APC family permease [Proteobacteria bacterium]|nr:APC family permease [Pseudomonadota bacterium]
MAQNLAKSLTAFKGTALLINIVIGAGLLTLPGLAVKIAGDHALLSWILASAVSVPLLAVFVILGRSMPEAGGLAAYGRRAFGPFGQRVASFLFLGAVVFGLPAIALTGGHYLATLVGGDARFHAILLVLVALLPHMLPGNGAANLMGWIASLVVVAITVFLAAGLLGVYAGPAGGSTPILPAQISATTLVAPFMMIFFAFTGWEVGAGSAEEYANPRRDFPIAMIASFVIVTIFYLLIAFVAQKTNLAGAHEAPFVAFVRPVLGEAGAIAVAVLAALIILANLSGAVWGVSRMVFSLARDGILPPVLAATRNGQPLSAVIVTVGAIISVLVTDFLFHLGLDTMLARAGLNFLLLYAIAAASLVVLSRGIGPRILGVAVILIVAGIIGWSRFPVLYPALLIALAIMSEGGARMRVLVGTRKKDPA